MVVPASSRMACIFFKAYHDFKRKTYPKTCLKINNTDTIPQSCAMYILNKSLLIRGYYSSLSFIKIMFRFYLYL